MSVTRLTYECYILLDYIDFLLKSSTNEEKEIGFGNILQRDFLRKNSLVKSNQGQTASKDILSTSYTKNLSKNAMLKLTHSCWELCFGQEAMAQLQRVLGLTGCLSMANLY